MNGDTTLNGGESTFDPRTDELEADVDVMADDLMIVGKYEDEYEDSCPVCHDDKCVCD
jgi:hypothetical protein